MSHTLAALAGAYSLPPQLSTLHLLRQRSKQPQMRSLDGGHVRLLLMLQ